MPGVTIRRFVPLALIAVGAVACGDDRQDVTARLESPADGSHIAGSVPLIMTASGIVIEEAGAARVGAGHFHVIADEGCASAGDGIPRDADHVHFGAGQSDGSIYLGPGKHELCLQVGDGAHSALAVTDRVTVTVGVADRDQWCAVLDEVDTMLDALGDDTADFAQFQLAHENAGRLVAQLADATGVVDGDVRAAIEHSLTFLAALTDAVTSAGTAEEADASIGAVFAELGPEADPGQLAADGWIRDTCGIEVGT